MKQVNVYISIDTLARSWHCFKKL